MYPLAWLAYTLIRGVFFTGGTVPVPRSGERRVESVALYIVGLSAFILAIAAAGGVQQATGQPAR